jgi:hypothetical protein
MRRPLLALDIWLNSWLSFSRFYRPDQTISQHAAQARLSKHIWACILCRLLDRFDRDHCTKSLQD